MSAGSQVLWQSDGRQRCTAKQELVLLPLFKFVSLNRSVSMGRHSAFAWISYQVTYC